MKTKIKPFLLSILPGIFLIGFNIGTGSVTAMAKAGANYGMSLLWTIAVSCYITWFLINAYGKFTIVTGETALEAFKKHIHPAVGIFFIIALTATVSGSVIGVMGIVADICFEMSKTFIEGGISPIYFAVFFVLFVYILFLLGETATFEKIMAIVVGIMALSFLVNFFIMMPPAKDILSGLIPRIPDKIDGSDQMPLLVVASLVGTTVSSVLFIVRTTLVKEAGWKLKDLRMQRRDATVSAAMMFLISAAIMAAAAGTLFVSGIRLDNPSQMIGILEPMAGKFASVIFGMGIIAAGISSQFPNIMLFPIIFSDYKGIDLNMKTTNIRIIVFCISLLGLIVPIFRASPILVMIISQAFGAVLLPVTVLCLLVLGNNKVLMKEYKIDTTANVLLVLIFLFAIYMAKNGLEGIAGMFPIRN